MGGGRGHTVGWGRKRWDGAPSEPKRREQRELGREKEAKSWEAGIFLEQLGSKGKDSTGRLRES